MFSPPEGSYCCPPNEVRVVIVDDEPLVRAQLREWLSNEAELAVIAEFEDGESALAAIPALKPHVTLMDINLPGINGLEATRQLKRHYPAGEILMLTATDSQTALFEALTNGASGYVLKTEGAQQLIHSIKTVVGGGALINPQMLRTAVDLFASNASSMLVSFNLPNAIETHLECLTRREREVLTLLGRGYSNTEIHGLLNISKDTVKTHVKAILEKLQVRDRTQAAVIAVRLNVS